MMLDIAIPDEYNDDEEEEPTFEMNYQSPNNGDDDD